MTRDLERIKNKATTNMSTPADVMYAQTLIQEAYEVGQGNQESMKTKLKQDKALKGLIGYMTLDKVVERVWEILYNKKV